MTLYSPATDPKYQSENAPEPPAVDRNVVISPDTRRENRLPPGQHRTRKWPVLHASTVPLINPDQWSFEICGLVRTPRKWSLNEFSDLPRVQVFADFHCVTAWSRLGNLWEGVSVRTLLSECEVLPEAGYAVIGGYDNGWTTNVPLSALLDDDVLLADRHDSSPIDADHGGPVRLIVPRLFAWKSAKWVCRIELTSHDIPGYWEQAGYHNTGDPWKKQRYRDDPGWMTQRDTATT